MPRTHYDNLKVARNAPPEVIRAAYRALAARYHPDRNANDAEATRVMQIVNAAYEVLSDPARRGDYDDELALQEIAELVEVQEAVRSRGSAQARSPQGTTRTATRKRPSTSDSMSRKLARRTGWVVLLSAPVIIVLILILSERRDATHIPIAPYVRTPAAEPREAPPYSRPSLDPFGSPWPTAAAYLAGAARLRASGLSKVLVDNSGRDTDVHVKLVYLGGTSSYPVRECFIPGRAVFRMNRLAAGEYDIRFRNLDDGTLSRSEPFQLSERMIGNATEYSEFSLTLLTVANGNTSVHTISEAEF